ncbi:STE/STE20/FRAY protein kinase [Thecamonas trahens ATCC 50062]|uniref:STE/STE20/FRAY protein kinase n=1 Tax=Thecamonas trahens ATCC 50062 TaxID=461836 RepID=A0A0L0DF21_THETB|nr:STE/STE20/FRAY protein kinase [Thecamonas trahens ATCC 50062]KNC50884.1 STE/STE20/FRAY protein kinase [Thecamonas trahens ATCC 50062]|eukprot:XP_013756591.1 STE/STE20/FRAY protein kinase [Thecamonas trahens ATCC 50062]
MIKCEIEIELGAQIGRGASADVYEAVCKENGRRVAVKVINLDSVETDIDEFRREIAVMMLADHENIVKYHCSFLNGSKLWLVSNIASYGSCLDILRTAHPQGIFNEEIISYIIYKCLQAIEYFHRNGQIHRDLKAANILLDADGRVLLGDFGVTRTLGSAKSMARTFVGTPCWMAPEVLEQSSTGYDVKADIWSLGVTAMELAHGSPPYARWPTMKVMLMILQNEPPTLSSMQKEKDPTNKSKRKFSASFNNFIASCLKKKPEDRPSAERLLKHKFIKQARKKADDFLITHLLASLPTETLADRFSRIDRSSSTHEEQKQATHRGKFDLTLDEDSDDGVADDSSSDDGRTFTSGRSGSASSNRRSLHADPDSAKAESYESEDFFSSTDDGEPVPEYIPHPPQTADAPAAASPVVDNDPNLIRSRLGRSRRGVGRLVRL